MAALPSPTVVSGNYNAIYEAYYQQIDPNCLGRIEAIDAARFLKKSSLSDVILSKIWDLSDPARKGYLDKNGFFVALKLCSLAQSGRDINMVNITIDSPPPKMGDLPKLQVHKNAAPLPVINNTIISGDWAIKPVERAKYDQLFESLSPVGGMLPGNKVRGILMESKLPVDTLGKIWDLADMDKDGMLDYHEFMVAMHLVYKALDKHCIPNVLPPELMPPAKRKEPEQFASFPASIPIVTAAPSIPAAALPNFVMAPEVTKPIAPPLPVIPWVVNTEEKAKYDALFLQTDIDKDGFVSGHEIRDVFLRSGVPQPVLAHIWSLCDIKQSGKLNGEQFALAMWLINQAMLGNDPPLSLTPEMTPPCFRAAKPPVDGVVENNAPYSNPELDMITKDIEELAREKHILETDIAQKEADIKVKNGEIKSLQSELDTLAATLKQLENQKGEAQKRLNDLKGQKSTIDKELCEIHLEIEEEQIQVDNLRRQADEQEVTLKTQEDELSTKKQELESLKQEEASLEQKQKDSRNQLDSLTKQLQDTQLQISQAKAKITHLQEQSRQMSDAITNCDSAIASGDPSAVADTSLNITPEFQDSEYSKIAMVNGGSPVQNKSFNHNGDPFSNMNGPTNTRSNAPFKSEDLFKNGPFQATKSNSAANDPFTSSDPFNAAFPAQPADGFDADPFNSFGGPAKTDPFDPFGDGNNRGAAKSPADMSGKDPFGCDPFAILHAPTASGPPPRPESPSPALPPKKSKQPPPRPAPPRPLQQPTMRAAPLPPTPSPDPFAVPSSAPQSDAFTGSGGGTNAFANFADFDAKFTDTKDEVLSRPIQSVVKVPPTKRSSKPAAISASHRYAGMEFTEDPFRNYRYEDPFDIADPFDDDCPAEPVPSRGGKVDPFGLASDLAFDSEFVKPKTNGASTCPEDRQLELAAAESLKLEKERRRRLEQEQADLEYALALSRQDKTD